MSNEAAKWAETKVLISNEKPLTLGSYFTFVIRKTPRRLLHLLSYYKFAARMIGNDKRVLDVGCSEGLGTLVVAEFARSCVGIDLDRDAIGVASETLAGDRLSFRCANVLDAPVGEFDAVVNFDVIEHIYQQNESAFVDALVRNLTPSGICILGTPNVTSDPYASAVTKSGHVNLFSADRLRALCSEHFRNVFIFSANDEMVHTGFSPMAHYLIALCASPRRMNGGRA